MCFADWLRNAWQVARAQRELALGESMAYIPVKLTVSTVATKCRDPGCKGAGRLR